jgi:hypothetical protein
MDNYKVEAKVNGGPLQKGKWTPIYDQSMMVILEDGKKFVTNFRYNNKDGVDPLKTNASKFAGVTTGAYEKFDSQCDQTMIGHVLHEGTTNTMRDYDAQCFYGVQTLKYNIEESKMVKQAHDQEISQIVSHEPSQSMGLKQALTEVK